MLELEDLISGSVLWSQSLSSGRLVYHLKFPDSMAFNVFYKTRKLATSLPPLSVRTSRRSLQSPSHRPVLGNIVNAIALTGLMITCRIRSELRQPFPPEDTDGTYRCIAGTAFSAVWGTSPTRGGIRSHGTFLGRSGSGAMGLETVWACICFCICCCICCCCTLCC